MTWTAIGSSNDYTSNTFSWTPGTIGNLFLVEVIAGGQTTEWATGITSTNATWVQVGNEFTSTNNPGTCVVFAGTATSTSTATATIAFNTGSPTVRVASHEFHSTVGSWTLDGSQGNQDGNSNTMPSLVAAGPGELYFCFCHDSGTATVGSTSGYTYYVTSTGNGMAYNLSYTSSTPPVWADSGIQLGIAVLMKETAAAVVVTPSKRAVRGQFHQPPYVQGNPGLVYANSIQRVP